MNKKQFFMLSLLICPFLYEETLQAGFLRRFLLASVATAAAVEIYSVGEYNKALPLQEQTRLAKEGHPYLDATFGMAENATTTMGHIFAGAALQLKNAGDTLQTQRQHVVPTLIKQYNPFNKNSAAIQDLEKALGLPSAQKDAATPTIPVTPVKVEKDATTPSAPLVPFNVEGDDNK